MNEKLSQMFKTGQRVQVTHDAGTEYGTVYRHTLGGRIVVHFDDDTYCDVRADQVRAA